MAPGETQPLHLIIEQIGTWEWAKIVTSQQHAREKMQLLIPILPSILALLQEPWSFFS